MSVLKQALMYSGMYDTYLIECKIKNVEPMTFADWLKKQQCETVSQ